MEIVENPFGAPVKSNKQKLRKFLLALTRDMGLYAPYNTDNLIRSYNYCKEELGDEFDNYLEKCRKYIRKQEANKEKGHVAINYLTDVFTKFAQIKAQLVREGKWQNNYPDGWSIDEYGLPCHPDYRFISQSPFGYTFVHKDVENDLPPLNVVYNKDKKTFKSIENLKTGEMLWIGKSTG